MRQFFILEYKEVDTKGREKNSRHVGVFSSLEAIENAKQSILAKTNKNLSFHVHVSESWF